MDKDIALDLPTYYKEVRGIGLDYASDISEEFNSLWKSNHVESSTYELFEVVNALLARQTSLAIYFAQDPLQWNVHIAPIIQRCLFEIHINLAWIFNEPQTRSRLFIDYGLGQQKLYVEHLKNNRDSFDDSFDELLASESDWLQTQRNPEFVIVDVGGNWAGISLREMADDVGLIDYYNLYYSRLSAAIHSNWHFIGKFNVTRCENVLHRHHYVPRVGGMESDLGLLISTVGMLNESYELYKTKTIAQAEIGNSYERLTKARSELFYKYSDRKEV